ncbi:hypothetical protein F5J12DRAFT_821710 [Pisolithus orientalis]|uniref:uncharacterized protein n=1 Tax=Pisolithus orientalis TaxID=936130 RepID=UPI0022250599|nr:uncharacterized protein F5J12DRAFT_821710 [Pisolithus orientalis]KAI6010785.1 hypothetical protein F5J12DRAFT_821710 [Pisolithus orientalis]
MAIGTQDTKRWTHFHSALQLAINRAAHKWTYEDFQECFALWCKEEPHGAEGIFNTISRHMEDQVHASCERLFKDYNVRENINTLHAVVTEARARKQRGEVDRKDLWKEDLDPRAAVRARTVPVLQAERERLKETLHKLEEENIALYEETMKYAQSDREAKERIRELLKHADEVYSRWNKIPHDEIGLWSLQVAENLATNRPP